MSSHLFTVGLALADRALDMAAMGRGKDSDAYTVLDVVEKYKLGDLYDDPAEIPDITREVLWDWHHGLPHFAIDGIRYDDDDELLGGADQIVSFQREVEAARMIHPDCLVNGQLTRIPDP